MSFILDNAKRIRKQLIEEMKDGIYADCERLPKEIVLAETLGISRTQLRDVLSGLEREGFITRKLGIGTIINHHVLAVKNRMDIELEFMDIIRLNGHEAAIGFLEVEEDAADFKIASKLQLEIGAPIIRIRQLSTADGMPAIYNEDVFSKDLLIKDYKEEEHKVIIFQFLKEFCDVEPYMDLTELHPVCSDERISSIMKVPQGTPLLKLEEVDYDLKGKILFFSEQYFVDNLFHHTILRKKF